MTNKKIPLRMCILCRKMLPKTALIRLVADKDNLSVAVGDIRLQGRSAYICKDKDCIDRCVKKKILNKTFGFTVSDEVYNKLLTYAETDVKND